MQRIAIANENETRSRLLKAAARLFGERGFNHVSVREICREAGANVASVNYHFRDKLGLYKELIGIVAEGMNRMKVAALEAGAGQTPEQQLCAYIRSFLHHLLDPPSEGDAWMAKLISREMMEPTDALDLIVEKGIKPTSDRLIKMVSEVMGLPARDMRVVLSALAVQAQCIWFQTTQPVTKRMAPGVKFTPEVIDGLAIHVANFSLAGMRARAQEPQEVKQ